MEEKIKALLHLNGSFLREIREYKNVSFESMMDYIKIKKTYLHALENDELEKLPAPVFVRGFVLQYAKSLGIDGEKAANSYMQFYRSRRPTH
jgi:cytoskeletal protein RodZ